MSLASVGVLPLTSACALVLGANLGAAMPAITATFADKPAARRVALGNLLFRLTGGIVALPFVAMIVPWLQLLEADPGRGSWSTSTPPSISRSASSSSC